MKKRRSFVFYLLFVLALNSIYAVSYRTELLKRIASYLPLEITNGTDSLYAVNNYPCKILKRVEKDEIIHLGFQLFSWQSRKDIPVFADFLERVMLDVYLQGSSQQMTSRLRELNISWTENGKVPLNVLTSFNTFLRVNNKSNNFSLNYNNKKYTAVWKTNNTQYEMVFMASRELIYGTDMVEAEALFFNELKKREFNSQGTKDVQPLNQLTELSNTLYRKDGNVYKVQAKYTTDSYYIKKSNTEAEAVFDAKYPQPSLLNMAEGIVPCDNRKLNLSLHRYGNVIEHITVPFSMIYSTLFDDMEKYFSVDVSNKQTYYVRVIYYNELFQYVHVLEVEVPANEIFHNAAVWKAHLYCFIPQERLKENNIPL